MPDASDNFEGGNGIDQLLHCYCQDVEMVPRLCFFGEWAPREEQLPAKVTAIDSESLLLGEPIKLEIHSTD